ncbi:uncharacterized protein MONOS_67 [Monocercomonoides exilis]|uniref:uncharacterized protein n=1 Tax=Monocercomonoides exilis TaxID=2049356 RepID=UPI003559E26B|nr:hypothetical protein MONOS_67 [Monocercomonoides exilis]|eukprot:MONOS_67.1-p1 / transcript=MONOS_67.1 / gene=MONOS_67 / organism=Monocercomonoides_exilis_PA203 / gene_product=unspecified product / transcript_product=unspecified product / location=Mono_scaffold00001:350129-350831(-) / protein_length=217 / sequence_SO=supercontig / SO=protein_coding / is_pseudo=false
MIVHRHLSCRFFLLPTPYPFHFGTIADVSLNSHPSSFSSPVIPSSRFSAAYSPTASSFLKYTSRSTTSSSAQLFSITSCQIVLFPCRSEICLQVSGSFNSTAQLPPFELEQHLLPTDLSYCSTREEIAHRLHPLSTHPHTPSSLDHIHLALALNYPFATHSSTTNIIFIRFPRMQFTSASIRGHLAHDTPSPPRCPDAPPALQAHCMPAALSGSKP